MYKVFNPACQVLPPASLDNCSIFFYIKYMEKLKEIEVDNIEEI